MNNMSTGFLYCSVALPRCWAHDGIDFNNCVVLIVCNVQSMKKHTNASISLRLCVGRYLMLNDSNWYQEYKILNIILSSMS